MIMFMNKSVGQIGGRVYNVLAPSSSSCVDDRAHHFGTWTDDHSLCLRKSFDTAGGFTEKPLMEDQQKVNFLKRERGVKKTQNIIWD